MLETLRCTLALDGAPLLILLSIAVGFMLCLALCLSNWIEPPRLW